MKMPTAITRDASDNRAAWRFTLRGALVAMALLGVVFAAVHYLNRARDVVRRRETTNDFKQVGLTLHNFDDVYQSLPYPVRRDGVGGQWHLAVQDPSVKPLYSWRFSINAFMESGPGRGASFDKAWDSVENQTWRRVIHHVYTSYGFRGENGNNSQSFFTKVMAITGPGTAFGDDQTEPPRSLKDIDPDTILVVETADSGLHWMQPGDFDIRTMPRTINDPSGRGISSVHKTGFHVVFADGEVWYLSNDVPFEELEKFFTVEGARKCEREEVLGPYAVTR